MTFFHFVNCATLAFAPYFIVYKYSGINEYSSIWKCAHSAIGYFLTQLVKLLFLATFFPTTESAGFSIELLKNCADILDVIGLHALMSNFLVGKGEVRVIAGGLGWGFAHSVAHRAILLWVGARSSVFTWKWIQTSLDSSFDMLIILSMSSLTWMLTRSTNKSIIVSVLASCVFSTFVFQIAQNSLSITGWSLVLFRAFYSIVVAFLTTIVYASSRQSSKKIE